MRYHFYIWYWTTLKPQSRVMHLKISSTIVTHSEVCMVRNSFLPEVVKLPKNQGTYSIILYIPKSVYKYLWNLCNTYGKSFYEIEFFCKNKICPFPKASYVFRINRKMCKFVYHLILELNEPANKNYKFGDHFWRNILLFCKTPFPKAFMKLPCFD